MSGMAATPYVREFTKSVSLLKVMCVGSAASPTIGNGQMGEAVSADALLSSVIRQAIESPRPLRVVDENGTTFGVLRRETVLAELEKIGTARP